MPIDRLITTDELAVILRKSRQRLAAWRVLGVGPRYRKVGSRILYSERDVQLYLKSVARGSTSDVGALAER